MSIIGTVALAAVGTLVPGGIVGVVLKFGAKAVLGGLWTRLKAAGGWAAEHWKPLVVIALAAAIVIYILILRGDIRSRDKTIASQNVLIGQVKAEVDRGVGKATERGDAPFYIRAFVDNVRTLDSALKRQSAALLVAKTDAEAHVAAAHEAAKPTPAQERRADVRQHIIDPARTTGLTADEWGKL